MNTAPVFVCYSETPSVHLAPFERAVLGALCDLKGFLRNSGASPAMLASILRKRVGGATLDIVNRALSNLRDGGFVTEVCPGYWTEAHRG